MKNQTSTPTNRAQPKRVQTKLVHQVPEKTSQKDHDSSIRLTQQQNQSKKIRGSIQCNKLPNRFSKDITISKKWPLISGYKNVNVCSSSPGDNKYLSPMKLSGIVYNLKDDGLGEVGEIKVTNLENFWQCKLFYLSN